VYGDSVAGSVGSFTAADLGLDANTSSSSAAESDRGLTLSDPVLGNLVLDDNRLRYSVLEGRFAVCRLAPDAAIPEWASGVHFLSITRTANELSIVCEQEFVPAAIHAESDWACLQLQGPFPFEMTGVLAAILNPLAAAEVGIFAVSTFDTDYVLVKADRLQAAKDALHNAGHERTG